MVFEPFWSPVNGRDEHKAIGLLERPSINREVSSVVLFQMSFYHSDDARAMASLAKANNAALYQNNAGLQNNYQTYPNTTSVPVPPPPRGPAPTKRTPRWNWASTIFACIGQINVCLFVRDGNGKL